MVSEVFHLGFSKTSVSPKALRGLLISGIPIRGWVHRQANLCLRSVISPRLEPLSSDLEVLEVSGSVGQGVSDDGRILGFRGD